MRPSIELRPVEDADWPFLESLYATTREAELEQVPFSGAEKRLFVRMQFEAQRKHYAAHFSNASFQVITEAGERIGRLYVDRRPDELRILDIALMPNHRGRGLGQRLLLEILEEARRTARRVRMHVEQWNRARRLYERLGFTAIETQGVYWLMEWRPPPEDNKHVADADL